MGASIGDAAGVASSALCFGLLATLFIGAVAAFVALGDLRRAPIGPLLPAAMLLLLLAPGVALQSVGTSSGIFAGWLLGTAAGAAAGVAIGLRARREIT